MPRLLFQIPQNSIKKMAIRQCHYVTLDSPYQKSTIVAYKLLDFVSDGRKAFTADSSRKGSAR
jgi:hypothetical protein